MSVQNGNLKSGHLAQIKDKLESEKEKIEQKERDQDSYCLDKNELSDVLDEANVNIQAARELRFRNREIFYLKKIRKALDKIQRKSYGLCDDCESPIGFERLLARPTADLCIVCKEESEISEKNNFFQNRSKSLGQTMNELSKRNHTNL